MDEEINLAFIIKAQDSIIEEVIADLHRRRDANQLQIIGYKRRRTRFKAGEVWKNNQKEKFK